MSILDLFRNKTAQAEEGDEKIIDLSDLTQYPASVLSDLHCVFALGDDSENMLSFLHGKWQRPSFHWGWDDITHEAAVNSEFLQRAFYSLDIQNRKRRDAMIASEGYRFVWKDKKKEAVPGIISGDELCQLLTRSREWGLKTMKNLNASEDRDKQRWHLNPTFADLMAELDKKDEDRDFNYRDKGCGMICFWSKAWGNKQTFLVNTDLGRSYPIAAPDGTLVGFTQDDIEWENVNQLEHNYDAKRLQACYSFGIGDFSDGVACVNWMLYPDGRYFGDEDGFGMEDNDEVNVSAYIDTECHVLVKFQDMEDPVKSRELYQKALSMVKSKGA